jgi:thiol-disulfide isomerase/thioredoxin
VVIAALAVYSFVATARDAERRRVCTTLCALRPNYAAQNRSMPEFELPALDGRKVRASDYRGKVVILNFWTKTCRPCLEEMPSLAELGKILAERRDVALVTITTDENAEDARGTLRSVLGGAPPFEVLVDPGGEVVTGKFGTKLFPETWFIDKRGIIRARIDGARDWSGALPVDFAETLSGAASCPIRFTRGRAGGDSAAICDDIAG